MQCEGEQSESVEEGQHAPDGLTFALAKSEHQGEDDSGEPEDRGGGAVPPGLEHAFAEIHRDEAGGVADGRRLLVC